MKTFISWIYRFVGAGAAVFLAAQLSGASIHAARLIYAATPALAWLLWLWLAALAGLLAYLLFSGGTREKIIASITGIHVEVPAESSEINALRLSFSFMMGILLMVSLLAFVRIDVHTGHECEISGNGAPCQIKRGTKRILFAPAMALPSSELSSKTLQGAGSMEYFVANTPPVGGKLASGLAFLTLLFIAISRISLMVSKKRVGG